jgi:hypothetical protein
VQRDEGRDDDATWQAIIENYGERPAIDSDPEASVEQPATPPVLEEPVEDPEWFTAPTVDPEERYVPPAPPPLPRPSYDRLAAWVGVFGSPVVLLVCLLTGIGLPDLIAYALVAGFVGGFVYLVWQMPRGPRDPWDDGAQI